MKKILLVLISLYLIAPPLTQAGKLGDFEESATSTREDRDEPEPHHDDDDDRYDDYDDPYEDDNDIYIGAATSWGGWSFLDRAYDHIPGEPGLPLLRLEAAYQNVDTDVEAVDLQLDLGLDWTGIHYNQVRYQEEDSGDELDLSYFHAVYRHKFSPQWEWHVGGGVIKLAGQEENSGASFTSPLIYRPLDWLALEFRPTWSEINDNSIKDYDLGIYFGRSFSFLKVGYRWVESGDTNLDAAYIGVAFMF